MTNLTILNIEDNSENRLLIRRVLQAEGYQVFETESAMGALEWLSNNSPDIILLDINMPEMDGYTLASRIRSLNGYESIPIIAITANALRGDKEKSLLAGCTGYIQKPLDIDFLPAQILQYWSQNVPLRSV